MPLQRAVVPTARVLFLLPRPLVPDLTFFFVATASQRAWPIASPPVVSCPRFFSSFFSGTALLDLSAPSSMPLTRRPLSCYLRYASFPPLSTLHATPLSFFSSLDLFSPHRSFDDGAAVARRAGVPYRDAQCVFVFVVSPCSLPLSLLCSIPVLVQVPPLLILLVCPACVCVRTCT